MRCKIRSWLRKWLEIDDLEQVQDDHATTIHNMHSRIQILEAQNERQRNAEKLRRRY